MKGNKRKGAVLLAAVAAAAALVIIERPRVSKGPEAQEIQETQQTQQTPDTPGTPQEEPAAAAGSGAVIDEADYPPSLIDFMEKYPEATQFVMDYPLYKDEEMDMDISGDLTPGELPLFLQWDRRWGYKTYGDDLMAINGCGPTCLSMVYSGLSQKADWNPYQVAQMAEENDYFVDGVGSKWELMEKGARKLGLSVSEVDADAESFYAALKEGKAIICSVGPGDFTYQGHFIVLAGIADDGNILVQDPNSRINSEKSWDVNVLLEQVLGAWAYSYDRTEEGKTPKRP